MTPPLDILDETSPLELVVVGSTADRGVLQLNNATVGHYARLGEAPTDQELSTQVGEFSRALEDRGITVLGPRNVEGILQVFVRDLGFVVGDTFVWGNPKREKRRREQDGLRPVLEALPGFRSVSIPNEVTLEGGDVVLAGGRVLVGVESDTGRGRTSRAAVEFLQEALPAREIVPVPLRASDRDTDDPRERILHLDCAFQPVGAESALLFEGAFASRPDAILETFRSEDLIRVSAEEMFQLRTNVFSISPECVVSAGTASRVNAELRRRGCEVIELEYDAVGKLGGLFRCSTLPLRRRYGSGEKSR